MHRYKGDDKKAKTDPLGDRKMTKKVEKLASEGPRSYLLLNVRTGEKRELTKNFYHIESMVHQMIDARLRDTNFGVRRFLYGLGFRGLGFSLGFRLCKWEGAQLACMV